MINRSLIYPCNRPHTGVLRLPTSARNQQAIFFPFIDMFIAGSFTEVYIQGTEGFLSHSNGGRQPQHIPMLVVEEGTDLSVRLLNERIPFRLVFCTRDQT